MRGGGREPTGAGRTESPARPWTASEAMRRDPLREGGIERAPPLLRRGPESVLAGPEAPPLDPMSFG